MADNTPTYSQIVNQLPDKLRVRFNSLGNYVVVLMDDLRIETGITRRFRDQEIQFIQIMAFIYSLENFMRVSSQAAKSASRAFMSFGYTGFQVGTTHFTPNNAASNRGNNLADQLRATILNTLDASSEMRSTSSLGSILTSSYSVRDLVRRLMREIDKNA